MAPERNGGDWTWPLAFRRLCEKYPGMTPVILGKHTLRQLYNLLCDEKYLKRRDVQEVSVQELADLGVGIKDGESLVQKIKREKAEAAQKNQQTSKREWRRQEAKMLAEARARGEL